MFLKTSSSFYGTFPKHFAASC